MNCLVIDCSTRWILCGLLSYENGMADGPSFRSESPRESSTRLVLEIRDLLQQAGKRPDWILCSVGPGSFTGIRIGVTTARGLAQLWKIPVCGIDTLTLYGAALAAEDSENLPFALMLDGRQKRYYTRAIASAKPGEIESSRILDLRPEDYQTQVGLALAFCDEPKTLHLPGVDVQPLPTRALNARSFLETALQLSKDNARQKHWSSIVPLYVRTDPAHARFPAGFGITSPMPPPKGKTMEN